MLGDESSTKGASIRVASSFIVKLLGWFFVSSLEALIVLWNDSPSDEERGERLIGVEYIVSDCIGCRLRSANISLQAQSDRSGENDRYSRTRSTVLGQTNGSERSLRSFVHGSQIYNSFQHLILRCHLVPNLQCLQTESLLVQGFRMVLFVCIHHSHAS